MRKEPHGYLSHNISLSLRQYRRWDMEGGLHTRLEFGDSVTVGFAGTKEEIDVVEAAFKSLGYTRSE